MAVVLPILVVQFIIIGLIILFLKSKLNNMLIEMSIKQLNIFPYDRKPGTRAKVSVTSCKELKPGYKAQIQQLVHKKCSSDAELIYEKDKRIMGGALISVDGIRIDCTLQTRLKQSGFIK